MVVTVTLLKEFFYDINRCIQDYKTNPQKMTILKILNKKKKY